MIARPSSATASPSSHPRGLRPGPQGPERLEREADQRERDPHETHCSSAITASGHHKRIVGGHDDPPPNALAGTGLQMDLGHVGVQLGRDGTPRLRLSSLTTPPRLLSVLERGQPRTATTCSRHVTSSSTISPRQVRANPGGRSPSPSARARRRSRESALRATSRSSPSCAPTSPAVGHLPEAAFDRSAASTCRSKSLMTTRSITPRLGLDLGHVRTGGLHPDRPARGASSHRRRHLSTIDQSRSVSAPRSSAAAFGWRSSGGSSSSSLPWSATRTLGWSSERSTSYRYQYSSHETTTVTTLGRALDGRTDTAGIPSDRATPATVCGCSEELNSSTAEATFCSTLEGTARTCRGSWKPDPPTRPCSVVSCPRVGGRDVTDSLTSPTEDVVARSRDPGSRLSRNRCRNERRRSGDFGDTSSDSGTVPSRAQPTFTARDLQSSQTDRRAPPLRYTSARSPRSSVRPQMSQAVGASDVLISR